LHLKLSNNFKGGMVLSLQDGKPLKMQQTPGQNKNKQQYLNRKIKKTQRYKQLNKFFIFA